VAGIGSAGSADRPAHAITAEIPSSVRQISSLRVQLVSKQRLIDRNRLELATTRRLALDAQRRLQVATADAARVLKVAAHHARLVLIYKEEVAALETPSEQATRLAKRLSQAQELHEATAQNLKAVFQELGRARQQQAQVENQLRRLSRQAQFDHQLSQTRISELRVAVSRLEAKLATERGSRIQLEADLQDALQLLAESQEREALARRLIAEQQKQIAAGDADLRHLKDSHRKLLSCHRQTAPPVPPSSPATAAAAAAELRQLRAENRQLAVELDALQLYLQEKALHDGRIHVNFKSESGRLTVVARRLLSAEEVDAAVEAAGDKDGRSLMVTQLNVYKTLQHTKFDGLNLSDLKCDGVHLWQQTVDKVKLPTARLRDNLVALIKATAARVAVTATAAAAAATATGTAAASITTTTPSRRSSRAPNPAPVFHDASSGCDPPRTLPLPPALVTPAAAKRSVDDEAGTSNELLQLKKNYAKHTKATATMLGAAKRAKPNQ